MLKWVRAVEYTATKNSYYYNKITFYKVRPYKHKVGDLVDTDPALPQTPERVPLNDDARKFTCEVFDPQILNQTIVSFALTSDWIETDEDTEKKLAHKKFDNGDVQILLIEKITHNSKRTSHKQEISNAQYKTYLTSSILRIKKFRHEFTYIQHGVAFTLKYDVFGGNNSAILEVDASTEEERNSFDPTIFPVKLVEVTGNLSYYGHRISSHIE